MEELQEYDNEALAEAVIRKAAFDIGWRISGDFPDVTVSKVIPYLPEEEIARTKRWFKSNSDKPLSFMYWAKQACYKRYRVSLFMIWIRRIISQ